MKRNHKIKKTVSIILTTVAVSSVVKMVKRAFDYIEAERFDMKVKEGIKSDVFTSLLNTDSVLLVAIEVTDRILESDILNDADDQIISELILSGIVRKCLNNLQKISGCEIDNAVLPEFRNMIINNEIQEYVENRVANRNR